MSSGRFEHPGGKTPADEPDGSVVRTLSEPLSEERVAAFSQWIDEALVQLEDRFRSWIRPHQAKFRRQSKA